MSHFAQAVAAVDSHATHTGGIGCGRITEEICSNYATALRKSDRLEEALVWYHRCLGLSPSDPNTHASIAFTLHLLRRFDDAISSYHRALAMQPTFTFCIDMLNRAMSDSCSSSFGVSSEYGGAALLRGAHPHHPKGKQAGHLDEDACGLSDMLGEVDSLSFLRAL